MAPNVEIILSECMAGGHSLQRYHTEKHIADVKLTNGYVLEFQNSPMNSIEMKSRESFYKKLIWVVNAQKFLKNIEIKDRLPEPTSELAKGVRFVNSKYPVFIRPEIPHQIHSLQEISEEIDENYRGHHLFDWTRPRNVWYEAECEVVFDF